MSGKTTDNLEFPSVLPALQVFDNAVETMAKLCRVGLACFAHLLNNGIALHMLTPLRVLPVCRKLAVRTQRHG